jgi:hypothetical protein
MNGALSPDLPGRSIITTRSARPEQVMDEIIFVVAEDPEGGFTARALGEAIFTEADDLPTLRERVRDAVRCHFDEGQAPRVVRLHFVRDDLIAV